jgi:starvation-inducible DNA-binding protein
VHELTRRVADVSERIRARMDRIGDLDLVSQDLLISVVGTLEQQQWMLRSQFSERS